MPFSFDVRTLFFVGAVAAALCAVTMWLSRRVHPRSRDGMVWSAGSLAMFGGAMALIALRGGIPDLLTYPVANALGCAAGLVMYEGVRRFAGARSLAVPVLVGVVLTFALQFHLGTGADAFETRLLLTSVYQGGCCALSMPLVWRLARSGDEPPHPMYSAFAFLGVMTAGHLLRIGVIVAFGTAPSPAGLVQGPLQMLMPTLFALAPLVYALVLIGLVNGRLAMELWTLASVDVLTGVLTRRRFFEQAREALASPLRVSRPVLLMLDLDRFKQINDRHGHAAGDGVLTRFAALLREHVPGDALIGRHGGEEFCVLLPCVDLSEARAHAQRLCDIARETPFGLSGTEATVTVSIGLADARDGTTLEGLLLAADRRLYRAKRDGRDRVVWTDVVPTTATDTGPLPAAPPEPPRSLGDDRAARPRIAA